MIGKIQNLIEDNTSFDITRNQVIMGLAVISALLLLIIMFMFGSGGPDQNDKNYVPAPPDYDAPVHI